ncbi:hypothetical protein GLOIN_2v380961 [Rhizophagus irregularis DAOM 181602=DAOM 197198]|uniref:Uncharacterized protein n=1 Tax=Rhizophagus irregularis (strain DAOM 181602 / DAOM 197198 / MUCL 43194) TaxID=747089 RepID=A0A2P4QZ96_RHIID|nr:hypothetical protein GLOIN_2v380961 [Rhizophagus irregularis DAOM 181602=DAOM 197198]POG82925.1 hypothetical protein GLOIN_2v380961 [Rhizophagus irregularis DAOM 181602=DAOM 197198]|eukprot:XP_025189791.1 hypothetical protein GLOIN_2v380961 [Rhizophagus irregularis DAOM 181602=DAOM 197198]
MIPIIKHLNKILYSFSNNTLNFLLKLISFFVTNSSCLIFHITKYSIDFFPFSLTLLFSFITSIIKKFTFLLKLKSSFSKILFFKILSDFYLY